MNIKALSESDKLDCYCFCALSLSLPLSSSLSLSPSLPLSFSLPPSPGSLNAYQAAVGDAMRSAQDAFDLLGLSPSKNKDREEKEFSIELDANPSDSDQSFPPSSRSEDDEREEPDEDPIMDFTRGSDEFTHDSQGHFSAAMVGGIIRAQQALQGIKDLSASTKPKATQPKPQVSSEGSIEIGRRPLKVKEVSNEAPVPVVKGRDQSGVRIEVSVADSKRSGSVVEKAPTRHEEVIEPPLIPPSRSVPPVSPQPQTAVIHQDMKSHPSMPPSVPPHSPSSFPPSPSLPPTVSPHSPSSLPPPSLPPSLPPPSLPPPSLPPPSLPPPSLPPPSLPPPSLPPSLPPPTVPPSSLPPPPPSSSQHSSNDVFSPPSNPPPIPPYNPVVPDTFLLSNRPEYQLQVKKQMHSYEDVSLQLKSPSQDEAPPTAPPSSGVVLRSKGRGVAKKTDVEDLEMGGASVPTPPPPVIVTESPLDPLKASYGLPASGEFGLIFEQL